MFRHTKNRKIGAALVLAVLFGLAPSAWGIAPKKQEVSVYFTVERGDELISGLTQANFELLEDGRPVPFHLEQPELPMRVVLVVEYSESSWMFFEDIDSAMQGFLEAAPQGNWYALVTYSNVVKVQVDFTKQTGRIVNTYASLGPPTWLDVNTYDAVYDTLDKLQRLGGRDVIILIGSGFDTFSSHTLGDVQKKIEATNATVFGVGVGSLLRGLYNAYLSDSERMDLVQAEAFMRMLANKSGGEAWFPRFEAAFPDVMRGIVQTLQHQYRLVYKPTITYDGKFHKIQLRVSGLPNMHKVKARVRQGWRWTE